MADLDANQVLMRVFDSTKQALKVEGLGVMPLTTDPGAGVLDNGTFQFFVTNTTTPADFRVRCVGITGTEVTFRLDA